MPKIDQKAVYCAHLPIQYQLMWFWKNLTELLQKRLQKQDLSISNANQNGLWSISNANQNGLWRSKTDQKLV